MKITLKMDKISRFHTMVEKEQKTLITIVMDSNEKIVTLYTFRLDVLFAISMLDYVLVTF